ncbi:MAG TPA: hypothetical protein VEC57_13650 [Candidatus Limnocylindrales bacterium]|nr:hypothetical protein [Candidatus Limnocylindrales bacterium]
MRMTIAAVAATMMMAGAALAGPPPTLYDHLECFKMRDTISFGATVNLEPSFNNPGIVLQEGCRLAVKSKEICFPVAKTVVDSEEPTIPVAGQDLANGFLCYSVKCPFDGVPDFEVSDQFGTRTVGRLKTSKLCVPADW